MFEADSRYQTVETATIEMPDGREVVYKRRRLIAGGRAMVHSRTRVEPSDRLDHIAARALGDPGAWWRICDANAVMNPRDIDEGSGQELDIPIAGTESL